MKLRLLNLVQAFLIVAFVVGVANAQNGGSAAPPASIPTFSTDDVARAGFFYAGGRYVGDSAALPTNLNNDATMHGAEYVEVWVPKQIRHPYPIVFLHDKGATGTVWRQTPDGRPGWAYYFVKQGYVIYMADSPTEGRSPYIPGIDGEVGVRRSFRLSTKWTDVEEFGKWPNAKKHTQWPSDAPNRGKMGDPVFDAFAKQQSLFLHGDTDDDRMHLAALDANEALLDTIGTPVILIGHNQGATFAFEVADARPKLVKEIVAMEPSGPPLQAADTATQKYTDEKHYLWGVTHLPVHYSPAISNSSELQAQLESESSHPGIVPCWLQKEPARKLVNLEAIPVLEVSGEASEHRVFDLCDAEWLNQAGVKTQYLRLEDVGLPGNSH
jgi:pimeloyl-ACP methyl ester carboxylesterase